MGNKIKDLTGLQFGRLTVLFIYTERGLNPTRWICHCACGNFTVRIGVEMSRGKSSSCGCLCRERVLQANRTHGLSKMPEYDVWVGMMFRCYKTKSSDYKNYGGRGIRVYQAWHRFVNFRNDIGLRPSMKHTIDRIDNNGNYEPGNVRWATKQQQNENKRTNWLINYQGEILPVSVWAKRFNKSRHIVGSRLRIGWSIKDALEKPVRHKKSLRSSER